MLLDKYDIKTIIKLGEELNISRETDEEYAKRIVETILKSEKLKGKATKLIEEAANKFYLRAQRAMGIED